MSALLVLIGGQSPEAPLAWRRTARDGAILGRGVVGQGPAPQAAPADTILVLPGSDAQVRVLDQATSSDAQARTAAAYLFRGALATEEGEVAYAVGERGENGHRLVAAFDGARIAQWLARCAEASLRPSLMHLDCTLWPTPANVVCIVGLDGRTLVAGGVLGGFTLESDLAAALITPWLRRLPQLPARIELVGVEPTGQEADLPGVVMSQPSGDPADVLAAAAAAPPGTAPVLRLADFDGSARRSSSSLRPWLMAGVLAIGAILIQAGLATYDGSQDSEAARRVMASAESQFRELRPDVNRIVNLRAQVSAALNAAQPPRDNPVLLGGRLISETLQAHPEVRLDELRLDGPGALVGLRLSGLQPAPVEAAVADLRVRSPNLQVGQQETRDGRVSVLLTLEAS